MSQHEDNDNNSGYRRLVIDELHVASRYKNKCSDSSIRNNVYINPHPMVEQYHTALLSYYDFIAAEVRGYEDTIDRWADTLEVLDIPVAGQYDGGTTNRWNEPKVDWTEVCEWEQVPVVLTNLEEQWAGGLQRDITLTLDNGKQHQTRSLNIYLPVRVLNRIFNELLAVQSQLGWTIATEDLDGGDAGFSYEDILKTGPPNGAEANGGGD